MTSNSGDVAWIITATALVMLMTPALGFFYGGLVRKKNLVSTIAQCFIIFAVISLTWALWGYSLAFGPSYHGIIGNLSLAGLNGVGIHDINPALAATIPTLLVFAFQLKFAAITPALIIGACAERVRFRSLLIFIVLWSTVIYVPIAHWVWNPDGWLKGVGSIDFAGGLVVHISAGVSALAAALVIGRRKGSAIPWKQHMKDIDHKERVEFKPTNIPYVLLGAALLWFGWFGFNAGSALAANDLAVSALVVTNLAAAAAAVSWMLMDWLIKGKPSAVGMAVGAVVGLVVITPASGFVSPMAAIIMGLIGGILSNLVANWRAGRSKIDDALDVFACHGVGGIWGAIGTGIFASIGATGLIYGNVHQFLAQLLAVAVVVPFSFFGSYLLLKLTNVFSPLRVSPEAEDAGLDLSEHGEEAYQLD